MKNIILSIGIALSSAFTFGQVEMPDLSPRATVMQKVGLTNFELEYSRPSVRDREIFGDILPFGEMWRTGANKNSMITFDQDIKIAGQDVAAGSYAIFTQINENDWDIYLYSDTENWGLPEEMEDEKVVAKFNVKSVNDAPQKETFTIEFENLTTTGFDLVFKWETREVVLPFELHTKKQALASIEKVMNGPSDRDYYAAASFYLEEGTNLEEALVYIKKAVELRGEKTFWYTRKQALIEHALGDVEAAIASAKLSLKYAQEAEYASYIKMNEESIKAWSK